MSLMSWDQSYSVNVTELDGHHQKLFYLMNCLHDAMSKGKANSIIRGIIEELVDHTATHFQREETLMEQTSFPGLQVHRVEHQKLMSRVAGFRDTLNSGRGLNTAVVLDFLRGWLPHHINGMDRSYSAHLNAHGIN